MKLPAGTDGSLVARSAASVDTQGLAAFMLETVPVICWLAPVRSICTLTAKLELAPPVTMALLAPVELNVPARV